MTEVEQVAAVLQQQFGHVQPRAIYGWSNSALNVLDCVLSLNRQYNRFVLPRVTQFAQKHPAIHELAQLRTLIAEYATPLDFSKVELNYNDARRAQVLVNVIEYLLEVQLEHEGRNEMERLASWAIQARPADYVLVGIPGFGLAGFQYLRMLFGAQTTKPDVHIIRFVSAIIGRRATAVQALYLLERAAKRTGLPLREVDGAIWQERARK